MPVDEPNCFMKIKLEKRKMNKDLNKSEKIQVISYTLRAIKLRSIINHISTA
jgi:hypothetical protein